MKTFVVSLIDSDRRENIKKELKDYDFEFIDAVNGKQLDGEKIDKIISDNYDYMMKRYGRILSAGEIGCSLSHQIIYRKMISENIEWAIILEDDIKVSGINFQKILDYKNLKANSIYILGAQNGLKNEKFFLYSPFKMIVLSNDIILKKLIFSDQHIARSAAYVIGKNTAQNILMFSQKHFSQADDWKSFKDNKCFDNIYFTSSVVHPDISIEINQSTLEKERASLLCGKDRKPDIKKIQIKIIKRWKKSLRKKLSKLSLKICNMIS